MKKNIKDLILYFIVGGIATVSEWIIFYVLDRGVIHYAIATVIAYMLSTFVNWAAGRILVFKESKQGFIREILSIYAAAVVGLLMNLLIMWIAVDLLSINEMLSKIGATIIVFMYNFLVRKLLIYRK